MLRNSWIWILVLYMLEKEQMDSGLAENRSCVFCTSAIPGGRAGMTMFIQVIPPFLNHPALHSVVLRVRKATIARDVMPWYLAFA